MQPLNPRPFGSLQPKARIDNPRSLEVQRAAGFPTVSRNQERAGLAEPLEAVLLPVLLPWLQGRLLYTMQSVHVQQQ